MRTLAADAEVAQGPKEGAANDQAPVFARQSTQRFFEILFKSMSSAMSTPAALPDNFNLSDATFAAIANSALALSPEDHLRAAQVRDFRPSQWRLDSQRFDDTGP